MVEAAKKGNFVALEYQTAQNSAQHHDQLVWTTTGILWGASLIILGFVLTGIDSTSVPRILLTAVSVLGITLVLVLWRFVHIWRGVKLRKYAVCRDLEELQGSPFMKKHHSTEHGKYPSRFRMMPCHATVSALFVVVWLVVIMAVWWRSMP